MHTRFLWCDSACHRRACCSFVISARYPNILMSCTSVDMAGCHAREGTHLFTPLSPAHGLTVELCAPGRRRIHSPQSGTDALVSSSITAEPHCTATASVTNNGRSFRPGRKDSYDTRTPESCGTTGFPRPDFHNANITHSPLQTHSHYTQACRIDISTRGTRQCMVAGVTARSEPMIFKQNIHS